jgi:hypothetical protein
MILSELGDSLKRAPIVQLDSVVIPKKEIADELATR